MRLHWPTLSDEEADGDAGPPPHPEASTAARVPTHHTVFVRLAQRPAQPQPWWLMIPSDVVGCKQVARRLQSAQLRPTGTTAVITNTPMRTTDLSPVLTRLFSELVDGASDPAGAFILNSRDVGLLRSLDALSADDASGSVNGGATIAAHTQHLRYGLSLMNRWANEGGNPFADAKWDEAWKVVDVDATEWEHIRNGLREETHRWLQALRSSRDVTDVELAGMVGSIAHLAYHLGAIRQINQRTRGPKEGTF